MSTKQTILAYYRLTKPGIIYGNGINALAGFMLASGVAGSFDPWLLTAVMAGTSLLIAAGCTYNNYIDQSIDARMERTRQRPLLTGAISGPAALTYATILAAAGFAVLALWTPALTSLLGLIALFSYVVLYGIVKRRSVHGTLVGTVPGALPPVAAYVAVTGAFDEGALILFLLLALWQLPHFYAIAMYRLHDYKQAGIPVLPAIVGMRATKLHIIVYTVLFTLVAPLLTLAGLTGVTYAVGMVVLGLAWTIKGVRGWHAADDAMWARGMFGFSLVVTLGTALLLAAGPHLP